MKKVKIIIAGAGARGTVYAKYALDNPDKMAVVGVAEPREFYRETMRQTYDIPAENVFTDWRQVAEQDKFADAVIIATQDNMHTKPALALIDKGYHILLEKPLAPSATECKKITEAAIKKGVMFAVCHVLRYTPYTKKLKAVIDSGAIGEIVCMQHLEPVGFWHQAHSFVRGNWGNEAKSSFMLLAKSCHDMDWINYIMGGKCQSVSSFGALKHFCQADKPAGAGMRCLDCAIETECPYSAKRFYLDKIEANKLGWPLDVLTPDTTVEGVTKALQEGPYGRCVYECDNDVVDNQVVNLAFDGGRHVSFMMTAFNSGGGRKTSLFGTKGEIYGDSDKLRLYDFMTKEWQDIEISTADHTAAGGHGGGDTGLMKAFIAALGENDPSKILSGPENSLQSHLMVFAAEKARKEHRIIDL
jgi:predicted dehydrogenase